MTAPSGKVEDGLEKRGGLPLDAVKGLQTSLNLTRKCLEVM
jgi:hypothetical protein